MTLSHYKLAITVEIPDNTDRKSSIWQLINGAIERHMKLNGLSFIPQDTLPPILSVSENSSSWHAMHYLRLPWQFLTLGNVPRSGSEGRLTYAKDVPWHSVTIDYLNSKEIKAIDNPLQPGRCLLIGLFTPAKVIRF